MPIDPHAPHPKFDTLFADPRHYRGDCRLMRTAVRRGWLDKAPQADRDALVARFEQTMRTRDTAGSESDEQDVRAAFAEVWTVMELDRAERRADRWAWQAALFGKRDAVGRPRERCHVSDLSGRIDANELRRRAKAEGLDLPALRSIDVRLTPRANNPDSPNWETARVALAVDRDARYGWRVWLVCPRCQRRRTHLYPVRAGVLCRACVGIAYAGSAQRRHG